MAQITNGVRAIFSNPLVYNAFQNMMGAHSLRVSFVDEFIKPFPGCHILDIGCGPAEILAYLPEVNYSGFDISSAYITQATKRFGNRGRFYCKELTVADIENAPPFDIVLAMGLLHHLDDNQALNVMQLAYKALKPGGHIVTFDPCLELGQNPVAKFLVTHDRGQNVRTKEGYAAISNAVFPAPRIEVRHKAWIPYTHCFMECVR